MLHIENIDAYSIRFGDGYGGGANNNVYPKTLEARKDEIDRIWISRTDIDGNVLDCAVYSNITLDGTIYGSATLFVVAFNALMASSG